MTAPSITVPVSSEQETVKVDAIVFGSTAAVEVTDKQLDQVTSGGDIVTVDVSGLKDVDSAKGHRRDDVQPQRRLHQSADRNPPLALQEVTQLNSKAADMTT